MNKKHTAKNTELDAHENTALASADRGEKHKCLLDQKKSNPGGEDKNERTNERASERAKKKTKEKTTTKTQQQR
jgi:hypothetical protein